MLLTLYLYFITTVYYSYAVLKCIVKSIFELNFNKLVF